MSGSNSIMTRLRARSTSCARHHPYTRAQLPRCEENETRASMTEDHPLLPDCDTMTMHSMTVIQTPESHLQQLDCESALKDYPDAFLCITDPRLARSETVWNVESKTMSISNGIQMFKAVRGERLVYSVKWEGGGKITTRIL
uniref:Control protein E4orf6/7 n=1 Tax=Human mastadenovirus B114 TaxID=3122028 RepID=A0AB38Z617_9ADEN|nr:control protein E4orf6/7 [Human adenovirus B, Type 114 (P114/H3/F3)]